MVRRSVEDGVCCLFGGDNDGKGEGDIGCKKYRERTMMLGYEL